MAKFPLPILIAVILALSSCATSAPGGTDGAADELGELLTNGNQTAAIDIAERVTECARYNGLNGYTEPIENQNSVEIDPAPGLEGRARVLEIGTGRIAIEQKRREIVAEGPPTQTAQADLGPVAEKILSSGPILDPDTGESAPFGCRTWAASTDETNTPRIQLLAEEYGEWMEERYESSPEYIEIETRQFECVKASGFPDIRSIDDANDIVEEALIEWRQEAIDYEEALAIDREIGLLYFDCYTEVESDYRALADKFTADFLETQDLDVSELQPTG